MNERTVKLIALTFLLGAGAIFQYQIVEFIKKKV